MNFMDFARAHGIVMNREPVIGKWLRFPTVTHPNKRNGAVKFMGDHGFVQEHSTMTEVAVWKADGDTPIDHAAMARRAKKAQQDIEAGQRKAAERAAWILSQCELAKHPYLESKGFPEEMANVWDNDGAKLLVIPMRIGRDVVGCQLIGEDGGKKFLTGQRTSDAVFVMDARGPNVLCEGYATALSIRAALSAMKKRYTLFVCFSAHNLGRTAKTVRQGLVVADNDASGTGERVAKETGWPYFMPPTVGQDFNDYHLATSLFRCSQALSAAMRPP